MMASTLPDGFPNGSLWELATQVPNYFGRGEYFSFHPFGSGIPGTANITSLPNDTVALTFENINSSRNLGYALPTFSHLLNNERTLYNVECVYPLSGQYDHLPRILFYWIIVFAVLFRHRTSIADAALGVAMTYSATACVHLFVLLGFYRFTWPDEDIGAEDATKFADIDFIGILPVVAISAVVLIPVLQWSRSFKQSIILLWSWLIFLTFMVQIYYIIRMPFYPWIYDSVLSVTSCDSSCLPQTLDQTNGWWVENWGMKEYSDCDCIDFCGLVSPKAPLRKSQGMVPLLHYGTARTILCDDSSCTYLRWSFWEVLAALLLAFVLSVSQSFLALFSAHSSSETVRNSIFRGCNASLRDFLSALFEGTRKENILNRLGLREKHDCTTRYRRCRRFVAKTIAAYFYAVGFFGLVFNPAVFVVGIVCLEVIVGQFPVSEQSDAVGSWAPWVAAGFVLLGPVIVRATVETVRVLERLLNTIRYDADERPRMERTDFKERTLGRVLDDLMTHSGFAITWHWWALCTRITAFKHWWKDPERYSAAGIEHEEKLSGTRNILIFNGIEVQPSPLCDCTWCGKAQREKQRRAEEEKWRTSVYQPIPYDHHGRS
ncbi:hypothetical protein F4780DRAFT_728760 [Xylariomycetidae sp. FL0641]|nr:hypothetical protein F4780DRAFT_728760 [Xylariomycetidae sp. FL0641]